jgi:hypothetical protein
MQGCLSDELLRIPGPFQSSTSLRIVRSIRPCQATADIICFQEVSRNWIVFLQTHCMPSWEVMGDKYTDIAIAYNPDTVAVKNGGIVSIKLYEDFDEYDRKRSWRRYLQAALPLLALLSPPYMYRVPTVCVSLFGRRLKVTTQCSPVPVRCRPVVIVPSGPLTICCDAGVCVFGP